MIAQLAGQQSSIPRNIMAGAWSRRFSWGRVAKALIRFVAVFACVGGDANMALAADTALAADAARTTDTVSPERISELILQLGAPRFQLREQAEAELAALGNAAYEAIHESRNHEDIEIRLRARRLVERLQYRFLVDAVPGPLRRFVADFDQQPESTRRQRIDQLALLLPHQGAGLLTRIARFENSDELAQYAALQILAEPLPDDEAVLSQVAEAIVESGGTSQRAPLRWLRTFAKSLHDPAGACEEYESLIEEAENEPIGLGPSRLLAGNSEQATLALRQLKLVLGDTCARAGRQEHALAVYQGLVDGKFDDEEPLITIVDWLLKHKAWQAIVNAAASQDAWFEQAPVLLFGWAEALLQLEQPEASQPIAERAFALLAKRDAYVRYVTAWYLEDQRGLYDWAEKEYRELMKLESAGEREERLRSALRLSEMLHDLQRDGEAGEVLQQVLQESEQEAQLMDMLTSQLGRSEADVRSRMYYFFAAQSQRDGDRESALQHLKDGFKVNPHDVELLIARYRLDQPPPEFHQETRQAVAATARQIRGNIEVYRRQAETAQDPANRLQAMSLLSTELNQLAWLVSNTEGNYREALRCSQRSLEFEPGEAGYLDTLGRSYFSLGDIENAIKAQRTAVQRSPHELQIQRQLTLFESSMNRG